MSVKEIAYTLGYEDSGYVLRIFKFFNRIASREYRLRKPGTRGSKRDFRPTLSYSVTCRLKAGLPGDETCRVHRFDS
jgi:hypothetical protein